MNPIEKHCAIDVKDRSIKQFLSQPKMDSIVLDVLPKKSQMKTLLR